MNNKARYFVELMLKYVVDCNWDNLDLMSTQFPTKFAVLVGISFSVVIRMDYVPAPELDGEICRVEVNQFTTKESIVKDYMEALGFVDESLTISS